MTSNTTTCKKLNKLGDFAHIQTETTRYRDTDRQGHLNNAVFSTFFECARVGILYDPKRKLVTSDSEFVIVRIEIDYLAEMHWPGKVEIGTIVKKFGQSSIHMSQAVFQDGKCCATSKNIMVKINKEFRKSSQLSDLELKELAKLSVRMGT